MNLTILENAVLKMMIEMQGSHRETIQQQMEAAIVGRRESTGSGFFTHFLIPADAQVRRDLPDMEIHSVGAKFSNLEHGAGFLLFIRGGVVSMLEGFSYGEDWPQKIEEFELFKIGN